MESIIYSIINKVKKKIIADSPKDQIWILLSLALGILFMIFLLFRSDWEALLNIIILFSLTSKRLIKFFVHIPYIRSTVISYKDFETFYLLHPDVFLIQKKITQDIEHKKIYRQGRGLFAKWIISQIPYVIIINFISLFINPLLFASFRGLLSGYFLLFKVIGVLVSSIFQVFLLGSIFILVIIIPIMYFRYKSLSPEKRETLVNWNEHKEYFKTNDTFVGSTSILLGGLLVLSYFLAWVDLAGLAHYLEFKKYLAMNSTPYSGFDLVKLFSDKIYFQLLVPFIGFIFIVWGVLHSVRSLDLSLRISDGKDILLIRTEWIHKLFEFVKNLIYGIVLIIFDFTGALLAIIGILFPLFLGFPKQFYFGFFLFFIIITFIEFNERDLSKSLLKKIIRTVIFIGIVLISFLIIKEGSEDARKKGDEILAKKIKIFSLFDGINFIVSGLFPTDTLNQDIPMFHKTNSLCYIPDGWYLSGNIGNIYYDDLNDILNDKLSGKWIFLNEYYITKYEITIAEYARYLNDTTTAQHLYCHHSEPPNKNHVPSYWNLPNHIPKEWKYAPNKDYPVVGVDWYDAYSFCKWATGNLPTVSQWEKALRGINGKYWPWGDYFPQTNPANIGTDADGNSDNYDYVSPKGVFYQDQSYWGIFDLAGNVSEWCIDILNVENHMQPIRGLNWGSNNLVGIAAGTYVESVDKNTRTNYIGIRCTLKNKLNFGVVNEKF